MFPLMSTDGVLGAAWLPTDGYLDPSQLTYALADGARRRAAARSSQNTRVTGIEVERRAGARGSRPSKGEIEAEVVVNAGGMYAAEIGRMAGVRVPVIPMSHEYLVTQPFRERDRRTRCPPCATPTCSIYFREEGGGLVMGGYERQSEPGLPARRRRRPRRGSRPTSTAACSRTTGTASRRSSRTRSAGCRRWTRSRSPS